MPPGVLYPNCVRCSHVVPCLEANAGRQGEGEWGGGCVWVVDKVPPWLRGVGRAGATEGILGVSARCESSEAARQGSERFEGGCRGNARVFGVSWGGCGGGANLAVNSMHICTMAEKLCYHCGVAPPCCPMQCCLTLRNHHITFF